MLKPEFSGQFKRDYKLAVKRGCDPKKLVCSFQHWTHHHNNTKRLTDRLSVS